MIQSETFTMEQSICHHLILKTIGMKDISLFNGRLGIAIAFFEYGRYISQPAYIDFANGLIEDFLSKVNARIPYTFATGASGIGWGIEYLIQNNFINCDSNSVCGDLDNIVMNTDVRRIKDLSLEKGIEGLLHYVLARIKGASIQNNNSPFNPLYFKDLHKNILSIPTRSMTKQLRLLINEFNRYIEKGICRYNTSIGAFINYTSIEDVDMSKAKTGLNNGLAGVLLNIAINKK